jgi:hypothetical protein
MDNKYQVKIKGTGEDGLFIANSYIRLFNEGYSMTVDEICEYLSCTPTHFLNCYRDNISHIRINTIGRDLLFYYHNMELIDISDYRGILLKRILYNRTDFNRFILENIKMECRYKRFSLQELVIENLDVQQESKLINKVNFILFEKYGLSDKGFLEFVKYVPEKLYSMKDLKIKLGFKHDVEVYRYIQLRGVNKYKLNNLVRYDIKDFKSYNIIINYDVYKELGEVKTKKIIAELVKINTML